MTCKNATQQLFYNLLIIAKIFNLKESDISTFSSSHVTELLSLSNGDLYTMDKIRWWLLKYYKTFRVLNEGEQNKYIVQLKDGSVVRLPPFKVYTEDQVFLCIYQALETLSDFHKNEEYFQKELVRYKWILGSDIHSLRKWVRDNEKIGADDYACFLLDYLDYSDSPEHLNIFLLYSKDLNFYVNKEDFKYTLKFLDVFQDVYWDKDILRRFE